MKNVLRSLIMLGVLLALGAAFVPGVASAASPANAGIKFKVGTTVSSPALNGTATLPARVFWAPGSSLTSGVSCCTSNVYDDLTGASIVSGTTASTASVTLTDGSPYRFAIDSFDANGRYVGTALTDPPSDGVIQDMGLTDDSVFTYVGTWTTHADASAMGGSTQVTTQANASASFSTGSIKGFALVVTTGPTQGSAKVYIDGSLTATVSTNSTSVHERRVVFAKFFPGYFPAGHTIKIVNTATSGHPGLAIDGVATLTED
jgi:hypothetical protein